MSAGILSKAMSEEELLTAILEAATWRGWRWMHIRRSDRAQQMGHSGWPDLVLARKGRVLFLELKRAGGKVEADQMAWLAELGTDASLVFPEDLDDVLRRLQ